MDAKILVVCDSCGDEDWRELTPLSGGKWDEKAVRTELRSEGWRINGMETMCPDCNESGGF